MLGQYLHAEDYDWKVGDRVEHVREPGYPGVIVKVESNRLSVMVTWSDDPSGEHRFVWSNKLRRV